MRVKHAHTDTHTLTHSWLKKNKTISQFSAYSILLPKSHYRVSTIVLPFVRQGIEKQSRPHLNINIRSETYSTQSGHELHSIYPTVMSHNPRIYTVQHLRSQTADDSVYTYLCRGWRHQSGCWCFCPLEPWGARRWREAWTDSCWRWCSSLREDKEKLGIRKQEPTGLQGYQFHQKHMEQLRMLAPGS